MGLTDRARATEQPGQRNLRSKFGSGEGQGRWRSSLVTSLVAGVALTVAACGTNDGTHQGAAPVEAQHGEAPTAVESGVATGEASPSRREREIAAARARVYDYLDVVDQLYVDPSSSQREVAQVAVQLAPKRLAATMKVYQDLGISFRGGTEIYRIKVLAQELGKATPLVDFRACISPGVEYRNGERHKKEADEFGPSLLDLRLKKIDGQWMVSDYFIGEERRLRKCSA